MLQGKDIIYYLSAIYKKILLQVLQLLLYFSATPLSLKRHRKPETNVPAHVINTITAIGRCLVVFKILQPVKM